MPKKKIYVGMALTEAPPEFREDFQQKLKEGLRTMLEVEILDFVGLENGSEIDVYRHDRHCTETADVCVFICDYPSTGLGIEIAFRLHSGRRMLCFARRGQKVTRMLTGMCVQEGIEFLRYENVDDILNKISEILGSATVLT